MTITQENGGLFYTYEYDGTAKCKFWPSLYAENCKIIKCPKVVREDGKQYKIKELILGNIPDALQEVQVPYGVRVSGWYGTITYY